MRQRTWQVLGVVAVLGVVVVWRGGPAAQAQGQSQDVLGALLVEVRGLRASMEQMASAGPRIQLATARLQLQEQRINSLVRRLDDVRANIRNTEEELANAQVRYKQFEQAAASSDLSRRPEMEVELTQQMKALRDAMARRDADIQRLQAEEAQVSADIAAEQGRWNEINQRLEELDRALMRK